MSENTDHNSAQNQEQGSEPRIEGVFSTTEKTTIGFGHTQKKVKQDVLVYAKEIEDNKVVIKALNDKYIPIGTAKTISKENLLDNYLPDPDVYQNKVYPILRNISRTVARGERHLRNKENFSAEMEFKNALRVDEENIRATFGLGLSYLQRGDAKRGEIVFKRLVKLKGAFEPQHKHMFNEFGIHLRKNKLFNQAIKYYARASQYSERDENLYFNMARTYYELGRNSMALKFIRKSLEINSDFEQALDFKKFLLKKMPKHNLKA